MLIFPFAQVNMKVEQQFPSVLPEFHVINIVFYFCIFVKYNDSEIVFCKSFVMWILLLVYGQTWDFK